MAEQNKQKAAPKVDKAVKTTNAPKVPVSGGVPVGVKIIAVLYYIGAVFSIIMGILFLVGAGFISDYAENIPGMALIGSGLFIIAGIFLIVMAVLAFFIGRGLWKAQKWARIVAIILAILGLLGAIISMVQGTGIASNIVNLVIHGLIGGYLLFSKSVKSAFA